MYTDALPFKLKQDGGGVLVGWRGGGRLKGRRHSLPEAQLNTTLEESGGNGSWRASTGDVTVPIIQRTSSAADITDPSSGPGEEPGCWGEGRGCGFQTVEETRGVASRQ